MNIYFLIYLATLNALRIYWIVMLCMTFPKAIFPFIMLELSTILLAIGTFIDIFINTSDNNAKPA